MLGSQSDLEKAAGKVARVSCDFSYVLPATHPLQLPCPRGDSFPSQQHRVGARAQGFVGFLEFLHLDGTFWCVIFPNLNSPPACRNVVRALLRR